MRSGHSAPLLADHACHYDVDLAQRGRCRLTFWLVLVLVVWAAASTAQTSGSPLRVGEVRLDLDDIFAAGEVDSARGLNHALRRGMNYVHVNTRPWVIRQELLFAPGDPYDPALIAESERNLRALGFLNGVRIAPIDTTADGRVNLRVSSRETWTLSTGVTLALASGGDVRWSLSATEKNFLGYGTTVIGSVGDDLDASYGRLYVEQNRLLSSPLTLAMNYDDRSDGFDRWFALSLPFRADDQTWSLKTRAWDRRYGVRWYLSNAGRAGVDPGAGQSLYARIPRSSTGLRLELARRVSPEGQGRVWRVGLGCWIVETDFDLGDGMFALSDGRVADLRFLAEPGQPLARDRGTDVWPHLILASRGRRWTDVRYLQRYGNREDIPLDPAWELKIGPSGPTIGSSTGDGARVHYTFAYSNWDRTGRGFWLHRVAAVGDLGGAVDRNHHVEMLLGSYLRVGPTERPYTVKTFLEGIHTDGRRGDQLPVLGLDRGLRTLDIDGMAGERLVRWTTELGRTFPWDVLDLVRVGWGAFYDGGLARFDEEGRDLGDARHELGCGLRFGGSRSGTSDLARLDLTYDLTGRDGVVLTTVARGFF